MDPVVVFYVSGHGYGHAARVGAVISALPANVRAIVRTQAPAIMFPERAEHQEAAVDSAVVESADTLSIDNARSVAGIEALLAVSGDLVAREAPFVRENGASLIVADIPFLAGEIARNAGVPAIAMGNFLWDWIFAKAASPSVLARLRSAYSLFTAALRFPLSHTEGWDVFPRVTDVPLVTPRSLRPRLEILRDLGLEQESRPIVLIGGRARLTSEARDRLLRACPDFVFLTNQSHPCFSDLFRACDIVVSKVGYSLAAECIAEGKRLLYPPRHGFREETVLLKEVPRYATVRAIPHAEWEDGEWGAHLRALLADPPPPETMALNGAEVCADHLVAALRGVGCTVSLP